MFGMEEDEVRGEERSNKFQELEIVDKKYLISCTYRCSWNQEHRPNWPPLVQVQVVQHQF